MKRPCDWIKAPAHWEDEKNHYISFVFSWDLWEWSQSAQPLLNGKQIVIGGPAVILNPEWVPSWVKIGEPILNAFKYHYITVTRTTTGCIRKCRFCAVPKIEGDFKELKEWVSGTVLIDNNLLASSKKHFNKVIDYLKKLKWNDFSQGLDVRLLRQWHVDRIAELKHPVIRFAWDNIKYEYQFFEACDMIEKVGIPKSRINAYVLIGFNDTPDDALYRLQKVYEKGYITFPMRYQSLHSKQRNDYVSENWTHDELIRYMKYWSNYRFFSGIPFEDFDYNKWKRDKRSKYETTILDKKPFEK